MAAYAPITYKKSEASALFDIPFDYLSQKFVVVLKEDTLQNYGIDYDFLDKTRIRFLKGNIPAGTAITISRNTDAARRLVSWRDASVLKATDLELSQLQLLHVAEESSVIAKMALAPDSSFNWNALGRRLRNLGDAVEEKDAVNLRGLRSYVEKAIAGVVGGFGWFIQAGVGAVARTFQDKMRETVSVKDFGAKGDTVSDDTAAIRAADFWCAVSGHTLYFPRGGYRITDGIESFADWEGDGAPNISTFALTDDKVFMTPGTKAQVPGSWILFDGTATSVFTTNRSDQFATMRFAVKKIGRSVYRYAPGIRKMGIVLNFNYKDSLGTVTLPNSDNRSDCDVGLLLHNVELKSVADVCVGGYWKKAGIVHFGIDPDNTHMTEVRSMGDYGLAIIGDTTGTNSGFNGIGCFISGNDHHSRSVDPVNERWGRGALYIDIPSATGLGSRNGISFIGGAITTKTNIPVQLDRCGAVNFTNVVFENATQAGSGSGMGQAGGPKKFVGTALTGDIGFVNCRLNAEQIKATGCLLDTATNATITIVGGNKDFGMEIWHGLSGIRMNAGSEQNFQMTNDPSSITTGVRLRRTSAGTLEMTINNERVMAWGNSGIQFSKDRSVSATITAGVVTVSSNVVRLIGGITDLTTITPTDGLNKIRLIANTSADIITLKTTGGNIRIGTDFILSGFKSLNLYYDGTFWIQDGGRPS